ncbi:MAG: small multi-drug export protein [candidate division WOR-3 bacterium]
MKKFFLIIGLMVLLLTNCGGFGPRTIIEYFTGRSLSSKLVVFLTAMIPIVELRGAIPLGINFYKLPWFLVLPLAIAGNIVPVLPILVLLDRITKLLSNILIFRRFFDWLFSRTRKKSKIIERYEYIGLLIFVAIPWPGTGVWTGALAAFLLGLNTLPAFLVICAGVVLAGIVVTGLSVLKLIGLLIIGIIIISLIVRSIIDKLAKKRGGMI